MASYVLGLASLCAGLSMPHRPLPRVATRSGLRHAAMCDAEPMYRPPSIPVDSLVVGQVVHGTVLGTPAAGAAYELDIGTGTPATVPPGEVVLDANATSGQGWDVLDRGDVLEGLVTAVDGAAVTVSLARLHRRVAWQRIGQLYDEDVTYLSTVLRLEKGGACVDVEGLRGYVPYSHWRLPDDADPTSLIGSELQVKFLEAEARRGRIVLSHRRVLLQRRRGELAVGHVVEGEVTSIKDYGAVVRLSDGLDGLLHISQLRDKYVADVSEVVSVGEKLKCVVIKLSVKKGEIGLSIKRLQQEGEVAARNAANAETAAPAATESEPAAAP